MKQTRSLIKQSLLAAIAAIALLLGTVQPALADGIIIPDPIPMPEPVPLRDTWLTIRYHRVTVTIEDQVAVTRVEQEFVNEHDWECEGTYVFPLPEGAAISEFIMWVDGTPVEGKILDADEARQIYEDIVRRRRDPALLEYVGRGAVQARVFPIPAGGSRKIELEYSQVLPVDNGLVRYVYPLNTEKFSARDLEEVSVRIDVRSRDAMRAVYSPTHQDRVYIERTGDYRAIIGYEESDVLPDQDFELVYTVSQEDVGLNLLSYREHGDDGFFLLLAAPPVEVDADRVVPRDVFLVLDTSGSMDGEKIEQAREALVYVLDHLNAEDRFNVVSFSTGLRQYALELRPASEAREAVDWVRRLEAIGGTDINRALLEAMAQADRERPTIIIFLTDGLPTEGVTEIEQILSNVKASAPGNVRLFPFGVGDDVNTTLLDTLAQQQRGVSGYVRPHERIDEEVSGFYAKISTPVLTDIELDFDDMLVEDFYPDSLPDLFAGTQLILTGRYRDSGATRITLTGKVNGERREFVYEGNFRGSGGDEFIPRLWATRKIGYLLTQIRLHGERREWVDAIVTLSVRYGIITPYTSFLIEEDDILTAGGQDEAVERYLALPTPSALGAPAAEAAEEQVEMQEAETSGGWNMPEKAAPVVQLVGSKTFKLQNGVWTDTVFDSSQMNTTPIGFGSDSYFELLTARPEWGTYLALGERVIFVAEGVAYEVVEGDPGSVAIPPTHTPEPVQPTAETVYPTGESTPTPRPGQPTPELILEPVEPTEQPPAQGSSGVCTGATVMGIVALAVTVLWQRMRV
ncbi:MAG: VWA domain-containing protein [Chloroflexi bacterium]|nr:VWA domain-containing protein [Chloroflexota bacterium]